jgi:hypothetical protein
MTTFEWNDAVKVVIGEISRRGQLDIYRWIETEKGNLAPNELVTAVDDQIVIAATRAVSVKQGKQWIAVNGTPLTVADEFTVGLPLTEDSFRALPVSLTEQWIMEAVAVNHFLAELLFKPRTNETPTPNEPASASGQ